MGEKLSKPQKKKKKPIEIGIKTLIFIWVAVLLIVVTLFAVSQAVPGTVIERPTYYIIVIVISFASFVMTTLFSVSILNHNKMVRETNDINFAREMQKFIAENYAIVTLVDYVLMSEEVDRYVEQLKTTRDFKLYMRENDVVITDILGNPDDYNFLTLRIPFTLPSKPVASIRFSRFKFTKENKHHLFVPCTAANNALVLYNETEKLSNIVVNLITKKTSEFYTAKTVIPFSKIKLNLTVQSLLGVSTSGWIELYFTNPEKLEKSGASRYTINSSQFKIDGFPTFVHSVESDINSNKR